MPIYADPAHGPAARFVADGSGAALALFTAVPGPARPVADAFRPVAGADLATIARLCLEDLPGVRIVTDERTGAALITAGGAPMGRYHELRRPSAGDDTPLQWAAPELPPGVSLTAVDRDPGDLVPAWRSAHSDTRPPGSVEVRMRAVLDGVLAGPLVADPSALLVRGTDVLGGIIVTRRQLVSTRAETPWVAELFRDRQLHGLGAGRAILQRAVSVGELGGEPGLAAHVRAGSRAAGIFAELGFAHRIEVAHVDIPGVHPAYAGA